MPIRRNHYLALILCLIFWPRTPEAAESLERKTTPGSEELVISGALSSITPEVGEAVLVFISLRNATAVDVAPVGITVPPFVVAAADDKPTQGILVPAHRTVTRVLRIAPRASGRIPVVVQVTVGGYEQPPHPIGVLEVARPYVWLLTYAAVGVPLLVALGTSTLSILLQFRTLRATREQKALESVARIITDQGRDYYFRLFVEVSG